MSVDISSVRIARLNKLMYYILIHPNLPRDELIRRLGIKNARMLQRDIQYLRECYNADIDFNSKRGGYKCTNPGLFYIQLKFTIEEITALSAGIEMAKHFLPHLNSACDTMREKLSEVISSELIKEGRELGRSAQVALPVANMDTNIFKALIDAAHNHKAVEIVYKSPYSGKAAKCHKLSPWKFYFQEHAWYMLAWNHFFNKEGIWRISRIQSAEIIPDEFIPCPCEADFENITSSAWFGWSKELTHEIELKILPPLAESVSEIIWHPTQEIITQPDGSVILKAKVSETEPVQWWVERNKQFIASAEYREIK